MTPMHHFASSTAALLIAICFLLGSPSNAAAWFFFWFTIPKEAPPDNRPSTPQTRKGSAQWQKCISRDNLSPQQRIENCTVAISSGSLSAPQLAFAHAIRCGTYVNTGANDLALEDCTRAIRLDPKNALAFNNRVLVWMNKGDLDRAMADAIEAIQLNPGSATGYANRGIIFARKNDYDRAIADYDKAIQLNTENAVSYVNRSYARNVKGDYDGAIADCDAALRLDPVFTAAYANRGFAYEKKGDYERAKADFYAALALPPKHGSSKWAQDTARKRLAALGKLQQSSSDNQVSNAPPVTVAGIPPAKPPVQPSADYRANVGSEWVYEVNDEITNKKSVVQFVVTEIASDLITVRISSSANPTAVRTWVFDKNWNLVQGTITKYSPHSGSGIQRPVMIVNSSWNTESERYVQQKGTWSPPIKLTTATHVEGMETVTTKAGTFEAFAIKIVQKSTDPATPLSETVTTATMWFAPSIDFYVKRIFEVRVGGHLQQKSVEELQRYVLK
jgi:tetratricopeptide (TPR) repeat protein